MKPAIRRVRDVISDAMGVSANNKVLWTPDLPIIYMDNPKSGSTTIKHSLKQAQASRYVQAGKAFQRSEEPHRADDCLKNRGLRNSAIGHRYLISCVRNPFTRVLSGYLDKFPRKNFSHYPELRNRKVDSFEEHLLAIAEFKAKKLNFHLRPQHINLDFPGIEYDAIFYLEDLSALSRFFSEISPELILERSAPHARSARAKLQDHYTPAAIELVQRVYARDFSLFGYSTNLDHVDVVPGTCIVGKRIVGSGEDAPGLILGRRVSHPYCCKAFEATLRFHHLAETLRLV